MLFDTAEHDLLSVESDLEVIDEELPRKIRELSLLSSLQVNRPEVLMPYLVFEQDEDRAPGLERKPVCATGKADFTNRGAVLPWR